MDVPIRVIGIVTSIIWALLIAVIALSAYSITGLGTQVYSPSVTLTPNHELLLSLPMQISNTGYVDLKGLNITTLISDGKGFEISRSSSFVAVVPQHGNVTILHNVTLNMDTLALKNANFLFEDSNLSVSLFGGVNFAGLLPATLSTNFTVPWFAPLSNFSLGKPEVSVFNSTHAKVSVPLSFVNRASFEVDGNLSAVVYDGNGVLRGETQTSLDVSPYYAYGGGLEFYEPMTYDDASALKNGHFEFSFSSAFCDFGPWRVPLD